MKIVLEMISTGLCGGAVANEQAEIRPSSVRGMLRWWFRVLGGFKSLQAEGIGVREQEDMIFGMVRGDNCQAGKLQLRTRVINNPRPEILSFDPKRFSTGSGYFLFPLRGEGNRRAMFLSSLPKFELYLHWFGDSKYQEDIAALGYIYGYLGSLGMRSRRAMGALAFAEQQEIPPFQSVIEKIVAPSNISLHELELFNREEPVTAFARWLRSWRAYSNGPNQPNTGSPGFKFAEKDHDVGYNIPNAGTETFRPVLGLPIIQNLRQGAKIQGETFQRCDWEYLGNNNQSRFASPVILRPYRDSKKGMKAMVIFVDKYAWSEGQQVVLKYPRRYPQPPCMIEKNVNTELYKRMKEDKRLRTFVPS